MSWIDTRTKEQKLNDNAWYQQGQRSEKAIILDLLEDYISKETSIRSLAELIDYIRDGKHHE